MAKPLRRLAFLFVVLLIVGLSGCPQAKVRLSKPAVVPDSRELLAVLASRRETLRNINGEYALEFKNERQHERATVLMIAEQPDKLYFELVGPTGMLGTLSSDGTQLRRYDAKENVLQLGPANQETIAALSPIPLEPADLVGYLLAVPRTSFPVAASRVDWDDKLSAWRLSLSDENRSHLQQIWFHPSTKVVLQTRDYEDRKLLRQAVYRGYPEPAPAKPMLPAHPAVMRFEVFHPSAWLKITQRGELMSNETYPPETFRLPIPKGAAIQNL